MNYELEGTINKQVLKVNRIYAYLANAITRHPSPVTRHSSIPYSFITALDYYKGQALAPDEIIISDYTAQRLNARIGDTIAVSFFVSKQFKTLVEDSVFLRVAKIVPLQDLQDDKTLVADFPGLSNVDNCTDWDSDLPINMNLISDEDEEYWDKYKNTPKALVPYSTLAPRWENAFGSATALHISDTGRLKDLSYEMFDIQLIYPRETGFTAAKSGVDFSSLFLSLGFFIIISAAMLMMVPLSEMLFRRRDEINLLKATGFSKKRIAGLLLRESTPVVLISAISGVIAGLIYTYLVLFLLGTVWKGATHTDGFKVYPDIITIIAGVITGIIFSMTILYIRIVRSLKEESAINRKGAPTLNSQLSTLNFFYSILFCLLLIINILFVKSPLLFVCTGIVFLFTGWTWFDYLIRKGVGMRNASSLCFNMSKIMWSSLFYTKKQAMLSFITLASGVFIVFSVGLNRQGFADSSQIRTATGGFSLWCETSVPVYHNIGTEEGRSKLALKDLHEDVQTIQLLKYSADDASCLNLNKVVTPNVLGIDINELKKSDFKITKTIYNSNDESIYDKFKYTGNSVYPALVDETVLMWSLGKSLGDTIMYVGEKGEVVSILLAGTLQNSIFQGNILIDKTFFSEIWSEISGSEILLVKTPDIAIADTKTLISQALNNYGIRIMTTGERLQTFYSVTDTYLTIFLTLGGLGLLLGIFSFIIVVRKNIVARLKEITLYRSLGFDEKRMVNILYKENIIIPLCAILTGAAGSLLGVSMGFGNVSIWIWILSIIFLIIFILCVMFFVKTSVKSYLQQVWI
jgi:putative ABC transport system permease protein